LFSSLSSVEGTFTEGSEGNEGFVIGGKKQNLGFLRYLLLRIFFKGGNEGSADAG
jgi:hypothetical protein